jgi:hypothetical protein
MVSDACEDVGEVGLRIDAVHPAGLDDGVHAGGTLSAGVGATEKVILASQNNCPVILPMSGKKSKSTTAGMPFMGVVCAASAASNAVLDQLYSWRRRLAWSSSPRRGFLIRSSVPTWHSVRRVCRYQHWSSFIVC